MGMGRMWEELWPENASMMMVSVMLFVWALSFSPGGTSGLRVLVGSFLCFFGGARAELLCVYLEDHHGPVLGGALSFKHAPHEFLGLVLM